MTTFAPPTSPPVDRREHDARISRVPYLPGLDGMRALAVVAVMLYHANSTWLPGGYLGVEMFFVISGYLITLLLLAERERTYRISLRDFWMRRARRLLPALGVLLVLVTVYTVLFERRAVGQLRGDVIAGFFYSSNWYQEWVGLGYTAAGDFAPLRHLWSLAVEEQFYLVWPIVMLVLLRRHDTRGVATASRWLLASAIGIAVVTALLYHPGPISEPDQTPEAYWFLGDRALSKLDFLYLGSFTRAAGIVLGAAFAMMWRPMAVFRGPLRDRARWFDVAAAAALVGFAWMVLTVELVTADGRANSTLFRGGLFLSSVLTVVVIAAVAHPGAAANRLLGTRPLVWIGQRSYGLYLFHWPVYQAIRKVAGNKLTVGEFVVAMIVTVAVTEVSYRYIEMPVRQRRFRAMLRSIRVQRTPQQRRVLVGSAAVAAVVSLFAGATLATADLRQNEIAESFDAGDAATLDLGQIAAARTAPDGTDGRSEIGTDDDVGSDAVDDDVTSSTSVTPVATPTTPSVPSTSEPVPATTVVEAPPPSSAPASTSAPTTLASEPTLAPATRGSPTTTVAPAPTTTVAPATTAVVVPATTVPPTTAPPTTVPPTPSRIVTDLTGVVPLGVPEPVNPGAFRITAVGDSVMLGAAEELTARGVTVDAVKSRQFSAFLPDFEAAVAAGVIGSVVIVHLGTNGPFPTESLDRMMGSLVDVPVVVFVTGKANRSWIGGNNDKIRALPDRYANVTVLDWAVLGSACGDCFYGDGIHLDPSGQQHYTDLLGALIGF